MKHSFLAFAISLLLIGSSMARTWTSSDGSRTFEGEIRSYDEGTKTVSVQSSGRVLTFTEDKLSEKDLVYLKEWKASKDAPDPLETVSASVVGKEVLKTKLHRLDGKRYRSAEMEKAPEFYILYYSASW
ncbi:MAG: hypothetical protein CMO61_02465 [Verrucomicrobiales bacterium]|jgi:hypothetical protein|nr:hypothetical protein [Verrucomicrobiales bacterium]|tara:strand:+ start:9320 stop:9706 length:387 start_codon:yes stop_codon:yes gene_type:complete